MSADPHQFQVDEYNLLWPEKPEFVRAAAKFDAIIVPFAGVGCSDIGSIYEYEVGNSSSSSPGPFSLLQAVFGGEEAMKRAALTRFGTPGLNDDRLSFSKPPPLVIPNPPWETPRFYYRFGAPIDTLGLRPSDKDECKKTYDEVCPLRHQRPIIPRHAEAIENASARADMLVMA